jgi:dTDP-4-dehydrorhamnose reductase
MRSSPVTETARVRILVLGAGGMLGSTVTRVLGERADWDVHGTVRTTQDPDALALGLGPRLHPGVDAESPDAVPTLLLRLRPDVVINSIGLVKQRAEAQDPVAAIRINALFPHRLAALCAAGGSRLIHISTDCVFSGKTGMYKETDSPDATDLYGRSKALGEPQGARALTLRTSIIGHERRTSQGLLEWFLKQGDRCPGYTRAVFSGLPTVVFARLLRDVVLPREDLSGLYHVASRPISKYDLLRLVREAYGTTTEIVPDESVVIDRSLDARRFREATGWTPPDWPVLIAEMHADHQQTERKPPTVAPKGGRG